MLATNAIGSSPYSAFGPTVIAAVAPAAPTVTGSTPGPGRVSVAFTPGSNGGSPVTSYTARCTSTNGGVAKNKTGAGSPLLVTGLTSGKSYQCRVLATNTVGSSPYGAYGATVVVS